MYFSGEGPKQTFLFMTLKMRYYRHMHVYGREVLSVSELLNKISVVIIEIISKQSLLRYVP